MFDNYYTSTSHNYTTKTTHEHRAPTDASVKLLNEMTEKARSNLISTLSTSNTVLQTTWAHFKDNKIDEEKYYCKITINGKTFTEEFNVNMFNISNKHDLIVHLYKLVCDRLASVIMTPLLEEMKGKFSF